MTGAWWVGLAVVGSAMLAETAWSRVNERRLRQRGAEEAPGDVYRAMALAYPLAFASMAIEGAWRGTPASTVLVAGASLFVAGKAVKYWAMASLGQLWSFRVLVVPGGPLVTHGPYRWMRHPNYAGVVGELIGAWLWWGAWWVGPVATLAFAALLRARVRVEDRALGDARRRRALDTA